jgi:hypothetical protein
MKEYQTCAAMAARSGHRTFEPRITPEEPRDHTPVAKYAKLKGFAT